MTFTLRKEQAGTELVCEIAGSDTQCNAGGSVNYQKGDQITVEMSFTDNCGIGGTRVHWNAEQVTNHICKKKSQSGGPHESSFSSPVSIKVC